MVPIVKGKKVFMISYMKDLIIIIQILSWHQKSIQRKTTKLPVTWASNIPKRYKRNTKNTDLYRTKRIASNLDNKLVIIKRKFLAADYPHKFITVLSIRLLIKKVRKKKNI